MCRLLCEREDGGITGLNEFRGETCLAEENPDSRNRRIGGQSRLP